MIKALKEDFMKYCQVEVMHKIKKGEMGSSFLIKKTMKGLTF